MPHQVGTVIELWRYPVKSFRGERLHAVALDQRGLTGDRAFAVHDADGRFGSGKTTRRFRLLRDLFDFAAETSDGAVRVRTRDGLAYPVGAPELDQLISSRYGEPLAIVPEGAISHFDAGAVHIMTTSALRWVESAYGNSQAADARRYRPNVVIETPDEGRPEEGWLGARLTIGSCELQVSDNVERCVMPTFRQEELPPAPGLLRFLVERNDACLGVYADVISAGTVTVGDAVTVEDATVRRR
jgi:uncharacterized protein